MDFDQYLRDIEDEMNRHKRQMDSYLNDLTPRRSEPETKFCPYCGHDLEVCMTFCPYCGADLIDLECDAPDAETNQVPIRQIPSPSEQVNHGREFSNLKHYPDLEEESQAKIGTFERLRGQYSFKSYGYDFNTEDYAPLVNLLSCVVEIETNLSLYQLLRALNGVDLQSYFDKKFDGARCIVCGDKEIELKKARQLLGGLCLCAELFANESQLQEKCRHCSEYPCRYVQLAKKLQPYLQEIEKKLQKIITVRNAASHKDVIEQAEFQNFYTNFLNFYTELLPTLLKLKKDLQNGNLKICKESATDKYARNIDVENASGIDHVHYDGCADRDYLDSIQGIFDDCCGNEGGAADRTSSVKAPRTHDGKLYTSGEALQAWGEIRRGVIFTNVEKLSLKYHQGINVCTEKGLMTLVNSISKPIQQYMEFSKRAGNEYVLLDMSAPEYAGFIKKDFTWQKHLEALEFFAHKNNISNTNPWGLFILGGDDVIPMPKVENPMHIFNRRNKVDALEADVDTDVPYSFSMDEIEVGEARELEYDTMLHRTAGPRFIVGRLPMETGLMETEFSHPSGQGDFDLYMRKMLGCFLHVGMVKMQQEKPAAGIKVENVLCTVAERFFQHARKSIQGLPMICNDNEGGLAKDGYFVSPPVNILSQNGSCSEAYKKRIQETDMLVYVTHGCASNSDEGSGFFGDSINGDSKPPVLNPQLIRTTSASVLAPVCCWGARFINYRRERSMLLTAMYESNVLTFLGSSRSAPAAPNKAIGGAEGLQNFFAHYVMQGVPVAEAMIRAKYDMLHTMTDFNVQSLTNLLCFVEFNLFGDPLLRADAIEERQSVAEAIRTPEMNIPDIPLIDNAIRKMAEEYNHIDGFSAHTSVQKPLSLLERLRGLVNQNLDDIRKVVDKHLYEAYGVEPRTLSTIHRFSISDGEQLRIFRYSDTEGIVHSHTMAFVNDDGSIRSVIQTI